MRHILRLAQFSGKPRGVRDKEVKVVLMYFISQIVK
jgi:hypothetical protein